MKTFSIKEALKSGWEIWKANKKILTLITLFFFAVSMLPNPADSGFGATLFEIIIFFITTFVGLGYLKTTLLIQEGNKVEFGELFRHAQYFWRYMFASILYGLIVGIGFVLLVIPGIYFGIKYSFGLTLIADKNLKIGEAFTQSGLLTQGVKLKLLGFYIVCALVMLLGFIALGIGSLIAMPVISLAVVSVYRKLLNPNTNPIQTEPISTVI